MGHQRLAHIITPIRQYLKSHGAKFKPRLGKVTPDCLPAPYEAAALRGEGVLRVRFFDLLESKGVTDPQRQLEIWQALIVDRGRIIDYVQRIGLLAMAAGQNATLQNLQARSDFADWAFKLYCGLLDDLSRQPEQTLFELACPRLILHHFVGLYPKSPQPKKADPEQLRQKAIRQLQKYWGAEIQLKESFQTSEQTVTFALRLKPPGAAWIELLQLTGSRLKTVRIQGYQQLLAGLKNGEYRREVLEVGVNP